MSISLNKAPALTREQKERLHALGNRSIDFSDIPEITDEQWVQAVIVCPKLKSEKPLPFAMEPEVFRWIQSQGKQADTRINALLKDYIHMLEHHR